MRCPRFVQRRPGSGPKLLALAPVLGLAVAGCAPGGAPGAPSQPPAATTSEETSSESVTPSITRDLPPEQRRPLTAIPTNELCGLVSPDELARLAFPVEPGTAREVGFDPPARGCSYQARTGDQSVLVAAQPEGYAELGTTPVNLGSAQGTQALHANDCTVFVPLPGATLQIVVGAGEADADQCDTAQSVAQYVLGALAR
ncbi:DUF3558 family protein [Saccharopolyspora erythraea]|uniref:DUF3558 family protein n=1 Tax=Saccharopolyspora erythraea TaxID=1836 RepID=UPI001BAA954F|nr:DUF3558 family protein [Saccharopolyspora erythraea]QUH05270.1 DUF3558 family protein [Saccharopolyspora erythraea]